MESIKGLLKSKTFYFNVITGLLEITNLFAGVIPPGSLVMVNAVGNIALRFVTTKPLSEK